MEVKIRIDEARKEPICIIAVNAVTEDVKELRRYISKFKSKHITGRKEDIIKILYPKDITNIFANGGKVFAVTADGMFMVKARLYELESYLEQENFVRISNSEIINLSKTTGFDLSLSGTIQVVLSNNTTTYVSRRYVSKIKAKLGM